MVLVHSSTVATTQLLVLCCWFTRLSYQRRSWPGCICCISLASLPSSIRHRRLLPFLVYRLSTQDSTTATSSWSGFQHIYSGASSPFLMLRLVPTRSLRSCLGRSCNSTLASSIATCRLQGRCIAPLELSAMWHPIIPVSVRLPPTFTIFPKHSSMTLLRFRGLRNSSAILTTLKLFDDTDIDI